MKILKFMPFVLLAVTILSCSKTKEIQRNSGAVNVINMAVDIPAIKVNTTGSVINYAATTTQVAYGTGRLYSAPTGNIQFVIVPSADTNRLLVNNTYNLQSAVYTMYITGTTTAVDTIFRQETNFPFIRTDVVTPDSLINIRFVNLSPNSVPVKIKLASVATNEVDNLAYKGITDFKAYTAKIANTSYLFQVRNAATDALLLTYTFSVTGTNRFKNVALIIKGLQGTTTGTNAYSVSAVNYF
jgi:hypothetical protein